MKTGLTCTPPTTTHASPIKPKNYRFRLRQHWAALRHRLGTVSSYPFERPEVADIAERLLDTQPLPVDIFEAIGRKLLSFCEGKVSESPVKKLQEKLGCEWPAIITSINYSEERTNAIRTILTTGQLLDSGDRSIVAFGSLARNEWTSGSDLDWTLLIDGISDAEHLKIALRISRLLDEAGFKPPGQTGIFGNLAFSHEIIHQIGGQNDTNRNTTQRILLLLESKVVGAKPDAYERVIAGIINRYLEEDTSFLTPGGAKGFKLPRFLLNDIARFWRTMAVDFASKQRERAGQGWALRNMKLRMSRKLIFAAGLLTCFSCFLNPSKEVREAEFSPGNTMHPLVNHLKRFVRMTPLEVVADAILTYEVRNEVSALLFGAYGEFLSVLEDGDKRKTLEALNSAVATENVLFNECRNISHRFHEGLTKLFFETPKVKELTRIYGVF